MTLSFSNFAHVLVAVVVVLISVEVNKLFPLAVFLQKGYMPGTTQRTHER